MSGEKTAVALALEEGEQPLTRVEQLTLLGLGADEAVMAIAQDRDKKIGRPAGARNRRTVEMANYLLSRYRSPLEGLAQIAEMDVDLLAKTIGCSKMEALQEQRLCRIALLPYLHSKMPFAVDITNHKIIHLHIGDVAPGDAPGDDDHVTIAGEILSRSNIEDGT